MGDALEGVRKPRYNGSQAALGDVWSNSPLLRSDQCGKADLRACPNSGVYRSLSDGEIGSGDVARAVISGCLKQAMLNPTSLKPNGTRNRLWPTSSHGSVATGTNSAPPQPEWGRGLDSRAAAISRSPASGRWTRRRPHRRRLSACDGDEWLTFGLGHRAIIGALARLAFLWLTPSGMPTTMHARWVLYDRDYMAAAPKVGATATTGGSRNRALLPVGGRPAGRGGGRCSSLLCSCSDCSCCRSSGRDDL